MLASPRYVGHSRSIAYPRPRSPASRGSGSRSEDTAKGRAARPDRAGSRGGAIEPSLGQGTQHQPANDPSLATALCAGGPFRVAEGCASPWSAEADWSAEGGSDRERHAADAPARRDALERAHDGACARGEPRHGPPHLGSSRSAATPNGDVQAEPRPRLRAEAARCSRAVLEP